MPCVIENLFQEARQHQIDCNAPFFLVADDPRGWKTGYACQGCNWKRYVDLQIIRDSPRFHAMMQTSAVGRHELMQRVLVKGIEAVFPKPESPPPEPVVEGLPRYERDEVV